MSKKGSFSAVLLTLFVLVLPFLAQVAENETSTSVIELPLLFVENIEIDATQFALPVSAAESRELELHFFWGPGCPFCSKQKVFLEEISKKYPDLEIYQYNLAAKGSADILKELSKQHPGSEKYLGGVPMTFIGDEFFVGFDEQTGYQIEHLIKEYYGEVEKKPEEAEKKETYTLPILGRINLDDRSLLGWAVVIALLDGFNICALGALVVILVLVLALNSRKLTFIFGGLFIAITALAYGLLIILWSQLFSLLAPYTLVMNTIIGGAALFGGIYFLKQFFKFKKQGPVCDIKENRVIAAVRQKLERSFREKKGILSLLGGIVLFAVIVTIIEFPCSAVFPVVFTAILAQTEPSLLAEIFYISIYIFFYMLIAIIIFLSAVFTKKIWIASGKFMTCVSLIGSLILFALAYHYFSLIPDYLAL